jgi:hypothetical protein
VFLRQADGKIGPYRMIWPAFWGKRRGQVIKPLPLEAAIEAVGKALPNRIAEPHESRPLALGQISQVLATLAADGREEGEYVFIRTGRVHRRTPEGEVVTFEHAAASPYSWPIGHDVRPAAQSLGSGGCIDCHAADASFSFGRIAPETAEQVERPPVEFMYELQGKSPAMLRVWASSFAFRLAFKILGVGCAGVLAAVLFVYGLAALSSLLRMCR